MLYFVLYLKPLWLFFVPVPILCFQPYWLSEMSHWKPLQTAMRILSPQRPLASSFLVFHDAPGSADCYKMNHSVVPQNGNNCIDFPYQFLLSLVFYTAIIPSFCDETVFNPLTILETSFIYSTVTDFARFLGLSTSHPLPTEM